MTRVAMAGWLLICSVLSLRVWGLGPENLLLIVNRNVPESQRLAEFYCTARQVPADRILALNLPIQEEVAQSYFDTHVAPAVRDHLRKNNLERQVTCVVTFYGVPLRLGRRVPNAAEQREVTYLGGELKRVMEQGRAGVVAAEGEARAIDPNFQSVPATSPAAGGDELDGLTHRAEATLKFLAAHLAGDEAARKARVDALVDSARLLGGPAAVVRIFGNTPGRTDEDRAKLEDLARDLNRAAGELQQLSESKSDPAARHRTRSLAASSFGALGLARLIQSHIDYLAAANPVASFDSELSMLWWNQYPRDGWRPNLLGYRTLAAQQAMSEKPPRTLMVMRLDAPWPGMVREIVLGSLRAERDGLKGRIVVDSRGIKSEEDEKKVGTYAWYDQSLRNLAEIVRTKTKMAMLHDESPQVLGPGSAENVALYCGWYSVREYIPSCRFVPGAVGFHVASYELVSLRDENERGWVHGMITDGIGATAGAVAEPYLHAFPQADDFFPLLMTGKLTLAEVYWRTTPLTSWMMTMIGDPLYVPFKVNPQLAVEDLPERLKVVFAENRVP